MSSTTFPADPRLLIEGDRIRFVTVHKDAPGDGKVWRTGTVESRTEHAVLVKCDVPNPIGRSARLLRSAWAERQVHRI